MKKYSIEEIQKKYDALPPNVKGVYEGAETGEALQQIGKEHKLMLDKLGELADETGLIILGLTHPKDYVNNLSSRLSIAKEEAKTIAEKVNQKIFQKIREELKTMHGIEEAAEEAAIPIVMKTEPTTTPTPMTYDLKTKTNNLKPLTSDLKPTPSVAPAPKAEIPTTPAIKPANTLPAIIAQPEIALAPNPPAGGLKPNPPVAPSPVSPFEQKLKENEILRSSAPRYSNNDPYREPTE